MARRIEYIIENNLIRKNEQILGLTFTNAAANEMYKKLNLKKIQIKNKILITTFHSFCYQILRAYGNLIGINNNFNVIGVLEREKLLLKELITLGINKLHQNENFNTFKKNLMEKFEIWIVEKSLKLNKDYSDDEYEKIFEKGYKNFLNELSNENKLDFNGILESTVKLWETFPKILEYYRRKYQYILIDEFQDTNVLQYIIFKYLINGIKNFQNKKEKISFMCFGDPFQSIYIFQGALAKSLNRISNDFKCKIHELQLNHRISSPLIDSINLFLRKGIEPNFSEINKIRCLLFNNEEKESNYILNAILKLKEKGIALHEICIIARKYSRLKDIKELLLKNNLYLIDLQEFRNKSIEIKYNEIFTEFDKIISKKIKNCKVSKIFLKICKNLNNDLEQDLVLNTIYEYIRMFENKSEFKNLPCWEILQLIKNDIFLEINWGEIVREKIKNKIYISAVHQVKGLEFSKVFFIGLETFTIPSGGICNACFNNKIVADEIKDEFNVLYVGISRTKSNIISTSLKTQLNIRNERKKRKLSCLTDKIKNFFEFIDYNNPQDLVEYDGIKCWKLK